MDAAKSDADADAAPKPCARLLDLQGTTRHTERESAEGERGGNPPNRTDGPNNNLELARSGGTHLGETARRCTQRRGVAAAAAEERSGRMAGRRAAWRNEREERRAVAAAAKGWRGARRGGAEAAAAATGGKGEEAIGVGMARGEGGGG